MFDRMSQREQALGCVQASAGKVVRYCCSCADSVWTTVASAAGVAMLLPSWWVPVILTGVISLFIWVKALRFSYTLKSNGGVGREPGTLGSA